MNLEKDELDMVFETMVKKYASSEEVRDLKLQNERLKSELALLKVSKKIAYHVKQLGEAINAEVLFGGNADRRSEELYKLFICSGVDFTDRRLMEKLEKIKKVISTFDPTEIPKDDMLFDRRCRSSRVFAQKGPEKVGKNLINSPRPNE